ncbi:hypothetical protein SAMN04489761_4551 [Tenacibaculum sp. MAR_2009_124]|uniref:hypothetical protein n=1 Tax=Tenacibaculum sp. MAR_2009_124 TaxID=1250059 RepID=UPI0008982E94|nr:hypothetical protein [Tenacibaculum sp. MAR_2009_124]SED18616.1 hypothetical protein SAMN04489761_4551 [Tenacibaculum sp. MAR_2009_124]
MKFFSKNALVICMTGALMVGALNLNSEQITTGQVKEASVEITDMTVAEKAGTPFLMLTFRMGMAAYRYYRFVGEIPQPQPNEQVYIAMNKELKQELMDERLAMLD